MKTADHSSAGGQPAAASRRMPIHRLSITGKLAAIVVAFSLAMAGLLLVLQASLTMAGGMRAYVDGEGLWSKGQKDGSYWLARYLRTRDETDFDYYTRSVALPLGDRAARLEMDRPQFDPAVTSAGLRAGGNAAADIPVMIYLYRHFGRTSLFAPAIAIWADADSDLMELDRLAAQIHAEVLAGGPSRQRQDQLLARLDDVNLRLTGKENAFSTMLGYSNRQSQKLLVAGAVAAALLLLLCGLVVSWWVGRNLRGSIARLRSAALRVAAGDLSRPIEVRGNDELADLAEVFNRMVRHRREAAEFSDLVMQNATNSISVLDQQGRFTMANRRAREITGRGEAELIGRPFAAMLAQEQRDEMSRRFDSVLRHGESIRNQEMDVVRPDGSRVTISFSSSPLYKDGQVFAQVCTAEDITERKRADAFIRHSAQHDALTNLPNRALLLDRLEMAMRQARHRDDEVAVLMIDLDNFKRVNDSLGHPVGDRLLLCVAQRLRDSVREVDTVARLGGDEFVIVLADTGDGELEQLIARITAAISAPIMIDQDELMVTPSIGGCIYPRDGIDTRTLLKHADIAMYHAKSAGRSNMQWFSESMLNESREKLALGAALRRALENEELRVYYQPKVCIKSGRRIGMEALVRWHHPEYGEVDPNRFIALAEETGQIRRLGEWVLKTACREYAGMRRADGQALHLAVNVSPRQFESPDFIEVVNRTLRETGLDPRNLELEITESMLMRNPEEAVDMLRRLRQLGVAVVIDDFGTGYSSLSYLTRFPIDKIKIDRSFVRDLATDAADAAVINAIIAMAHSLGIRVVAEGVETEAQQAYLRERGCDEAQGFLYSRAVTAAQFQSLAA
jgi:diguanylate cyclase (GGDEF)-like protein/PAS domain S-box-containing protein